MQYTIMSFNLLCIRDTIARRARVVSAIRAYMPDILGVQEATPRWMAHLSAALPEYTPLGTGRGRDGGDEASAIFVKKERFAVLESGTRWLSEHPYTYSYVEGSLCPRVFTYAVLRDRTDGYTFCHVNTHLDHGTEEVRTVQAHLLHRFAEKMGAHMPVTVTGDFNCEENESAVYRYMTEDRFADAKAEAATVYAASTFHGYENFVSVIDYCFVQRDAFTVSEYKVIDELFDGEHPSDHNPILVTLSPGR